VGDLVEERGSNKGREKAAKRNLT